jgi:hypothetical protein
MEPTIKIEYDMDDIAQKTMDEKLTLLLRIAFSNHETLQTHGKILFGNGNAGLCDNTRSHSRAIKVIWCFIVLIIGGIVGMVFK